MDQQSKTTDLKFISIYNTLSFHPESTLISKLVQMIVFLRTRVGGNTVVNNLRNDLAHILPSPPKLVPHVTVWNTNLQEGLSVQFQGCTTSVWPVLNKTLLSLQRKALSNFANEIKAIIRFLQ